MTCHRCGKDVGSDGVRPPRRFVLREGQRLVLHDNLYHPKCVPPHIFHDRGNKHEQIRRKRDAYMAELKRRIQTGEPIFTPATSLSEKFEPWTF